MNKHASETPKESTVCGCQRGTAGTSHDEGHTMHIQMRKKYPSHEQAFRDKEARLGSHTPKDTGCRYTRTRDMKTRHLMHALTNNDDSSLFRTTEKSRSNQWTDSQSREKDKRHHTRIQKCWGKHDCHKGHT